MPILYKAAIFVIISAGFGWLTRNSVRSVRSHGFYRFFAVLAITALILLNLEVWFADLLSLRQIASTILLTICTYLVVHGTWLLVRAGKPERARTDRELLGIEKTTALVTTGIYRYIRHPLYSSLLFLAWGAFLKQVSMPGAALALVATACLAITARIEETENEDYFGAAYREYRKRTKMFLPFLF